MLSDMLCAGARNGLSQRCCHKLGQLHHFETINFIIPWLMRGERDFMAAGRSLRCLAFAFVEQLPHAIAVVRRRARSAAPGRARSARAAIALTVLYAAAGTC